MRGTADRASPLLGDVLVSRPGDDAGVIGAASLWSDAPGRASFTAKEERR